MILSSFGPEEIWGLILIAFGMGAAALVVVLFIFIKIIKFFLRK